MNITFADDWECDSSLTVAQAEKIYAKMKVKYAKVCKEMKYDNSYLEVTNDA